MDNSHGPRASLDFTHVLYDDSSLFAFALALVTLSPILLMASYAALVVQTRELTIIVMWAGQLAGELLNAFLKHAVQQARPNESLGSGYGFPSSHAQYMGYFASFLTCHLFFRHRFTSTDMPTLDALFRMLVYFVLYTWAGLVAYSRYYLGYHSLCQVGWGFAIGVALGVLLYVASDLVPAHWPASRLGRFKKFVLNSTVATWLRIRDGWAVWEDGGREREWLMWKKEWEKAQLPKKME